MLVRIKDTPYKGRGVFAKQRILKGTLIEEAPVIEIPPAEVDFIKSTQLFNYFFRWPQKGAAIALGYASLYNHSYDPNTRYIKRIGHKTIVFYAIRHIDEGEELTINYNGAPADRSPIWFEAV